MVRDYVRHFFTVSERNELITVNLLILRYFYIDSKTGHDRIFIQRVYCERMLNKEYIVKLGDNNVRLR